MTYRFVKCVEGQVLNVYKPTLLETTVLLKTPKGFSHSTYLEP
jgi:hypothetical protein